MRYYKLSFSKLFSPAFTNHNFSEPLFIHATFFSMQLVVALVFLLSLLIKQDTALKKLLYLFCSCILTAGIIQLSSKSIFITLLISIVVALPYFLLTGKKRFRFMIASAALAFITASIILSLPAFRERYITELRKDLSISIAGAPIDTRMARWDVVVELIEKSPVIGYGAGSEIGLLQETFFNKKLFNSYLNGLNAHSEYLSMLLKSGAVGLLIYLITMGYGFNISIRQKDLLFFTFITMIAIVSLSENLLDVDKGIFFYAFFFSFFAFSLDDRIDNSLKINKRISLIKQEAEALI
jgi:O-antigen ligase